MNQRPTRTAVAEDASFQEVERPNALPARAEPQRTETAATVSERVEEAEPELPETGPAAVIAAIAAIMAEIKPVEKLGWNDFQKYAHVRMQDLSRELTPLMGKHGIVVFQTEEGRELFDGGAAVAVRYRFTVVHKSGAIWPQRPLQTGVSSCRSTKGGFDDKALNKCHTAARKYFLLSLFQIASEDEDDSDRGSPQDNGNGNHRPRPQGRRPVPSPSGKLPPHLLPVVEGEAPEAWATRFKGFVDKAESTAEIDKWYDANIAVFEKLKAGKFMVAYNDLLDFMDAKGAQFAAPAKAADPISSGPATASAGGFPGDKTMPSLTDSDEKWLQGLRDTFAQCETAEELAEEQKSSMLPSKDAVSIVAWGDAVKLVSDNLKRIQG